MKFGVLVTARLHSFGVIALALAGLGYALQFRFGEESLGRAVGLWDVLLGVATNPQFIAFAVVPAWLLMIVAGSRQAASPELIIRLGSFRAQWLWAGQNGVATCLAGIFLLVVAIAVGALGLPPQSQVLVGSTAEFFLEKQIVPTYAFVLQIVFVAISLLTMQGVLVALRLINGSPFVGVAGTVLIGVWVLLSTVGQIPDSSPANALFYLNFAHWFRLPDIGMIAIAGSAATASLSFLVAVALDRRASRRTTLTPSPTLVYGFLATGVVALAVTSAFQRSSKFWDVVAEAFYGTPGTVTQYLVSMFVFAGFAFVFMLRQSIDGTGIRDLRILRYGSFGKFSSRVLAREIYRAFGLFLYLTAVCVVCFLLAGGRDMGSSGDLGSLAYQFYVNGFLQIVFYLLLTFVASCLTNLPLAGTFTIVSIVALGATPLGATSHSPIGAASMFWASMGWESLHDVTVSLSIGIAAATIALVTISRRRRPSLRKGVRL